MRRRSFLLGAVFQQAAPPPPLLLITTAEAARLKPPARLKTLRDQAIQQEPLSVTFHRPGPLSKAGPHDFFSEGPYWWPNPANPTGPYIRKDGQVNPDRFENNDRDLNRMSETVCTLGLAAYFHKDRAAAAHAWQLLDTWFLAPATLMNPNLEFGQAIRGVTEGRGIGIIDTRPLIWCVQGALLLQAAFPDQPRMNALRAWFASFTTWLTTSKKGIDERDNGNNHSTWWAAQVAAYAVFCHDEKAERLAYAQYRNTIVPNQLRPDGAAPEEEARTRSLSYSAMNLDGFAILCRIAANRGTDLWTYKAKDGAGVLTSAAYLIPFLEGAAAWTKPQITPIDKIRPYFPGLAGLATHNKSWLALQRKIGPLNGPWGVILEMLLQ